jgi:hypothetical protein
MAEQYTFIGRKLDSDALMTFAEERRIPTAEAQKIRNEALVTESVRLAGSGVLIQCPVGPHDDPTLAPALARRCALSPTASVAIQCMQLHWAEYPCL